MSVRERERNAIRVALKAHPTLLLRSSTEFGLKHILDILTADHVKGDEEAALLRKFNHPDLTYLDSKAVDTKTAREISQSIRDRSTAYPSCWSKRYLVIGNIDRLHPIAIQTLLKLIEEPSVHLLNVLITNRMDLVLPTVISRSTLLSLKPPSTKEIEDLLRAKGVEEPVWRAQVCGRDPEVAIELNPSLTKEWDKLWRITLSGISLPSDFVCSWNELLSDANEATHIAVWDLLVQIASREPSNYFWRGVALRAMWERERAFRGNLNKLYTGTALTVVYAYAKTAVKHKIT